MITASLCPVHAAEWTAWGDYRLPPAPIVLISIGDQSAANDEFRRTRRYEEWKATITSQRALIRASCDKGQSCSTQGHVSGVRHVETVAAL